MYSFIDYLIIFAPRAGADRPVDAARRQDRAAQARPARPRDSNPLPEDQGVAFFGRARGEEILWAHEGRGASVGVRGAGWRPLTARAVRRRERELEARVAELARARGAGAGRGTGGAEDEEEEVPSPPPFFTVPPIACTTIPSPRRRRPARVALMTSS
jgi:hypothetical protein